MENKRKFGRSLFTKISMGETTNFSKFFNNSSIGKESIFPKAPIVVGMLGVFIFIAVIGLSGNTLVLLIFKRTKSMRTTTNILIANLAFADFLTMLFGIPSMVLSSLKNHPGNTFGVLLCKFLTVGNIPSVCLAVSILTLTLMAYERYNAIVQPMRAKRRLTKENVVFCICFMWITGFAFILPSFISTKHSTENKFCYDSLNDNQRQTYYIILLIFLFFTPLSIIIYCYMKIIKELQVASGIAPGNLSARQNIREKRRIAKVLLLVSLTFSTCFGAFGVTRVLEDAGNVSHLTSEIALMLLYSNAAFDPIIYAFQSSNYINAFKNMFHCQGSKAILSLRLSYERRNATERSEVKIGD